ncbi:GAF domain-containing protein [Deinococcus sp. UYEF24]
MSLQSDRLNLDEAQRLAALERYAILDTDPEVSFDRLTRLTARLLRVPIVLISLVDDHRQWFKSCYGLDLRQTDRSISFCAHALASDDVLVIPDTTQDERFVDNPLVLYGPHIRFYAGAPLVTPEGLRLGTLCVLDTVPHAEFTAAEQEILQELASSVMSELELRTALADRRQTEAVNAAILAASPDAIITLDAQGLITEWNSAAERMSGYTSREVLGQSSQLLIGEINENVSGQELWSFFQAQTPDEMDCFFISLRRRDQLSLEKCGC